MVTEKQADDQATRDEHLKKIVEKSLKPETSNSGALTEEDKSFIEDKRWPVAKENRIYDSKKTEIEEEQIQISSEEWKSKLLEKYDELKKVFQEEIVDGGILLRIIRRNYRSSEE